MRARRLAETPGRVVAREGPPVLLSARFRASASSEKDGRRMALDRKTVAHIARLARIKVRDDELDALAGELSGILTWVEQLQKVDVAGVEPMTGAVAMALKQRADEVTDGGVRDKVLANAPASQNGFFAVPKVIE
jgi:aspartyl-tRNA(Asn)/glutamyl-tRNA(Gln) amidotransferase subunit C